MPRFKALLTLLELQGASLHDEKIRGVTRKAWTDMATSGTESPAWAGRLSGGGTTVSVIVATAIVVADMVGVGVFTSLGFQVKDIPSGFWISGGLGVGDGRLRRTGGSGGDGFRGIRQIGASGRAAAGARDWRGLAGVDCSTRRRQALKHLPTDLDHLESR